ncbi:MAG TPA: 16S rRNA (adenine(1518)-N(6)/adenine(1519)-N(6))-dimethyltransferase RsmA, partial [Chloroflexota bacterium]|nr:16S rRNA (adenine(1518)-N(6)/adenine(1519)-N(6))-dimethyltransferase RsmA [Chloroflexota bacterium]
MSPRKGGSGAVGPVKRRTSGGPSKRRTRRGGQDAVDRHITSQLTPGVKSLLKHFGLRPQKGFGQNFLIDDEILARIVEVADLRSDDQVVEVGPGLGVLTRELVSRVRRVIAVEIDRGMAEALQTLFSDQPNLEVVNQDILSFRPGQHLDENPYKVVANLPYYITSPTLRLFLESERQPTSIIVMVQKEVAERIVAKPGDLSLLAVSVQFYAEPMIVARVPRMAFYPAPKVDSAVVRIDVRPTPVVPVDPEKFFRVVSAGFAQPRKQLHNALSRVLWLPEDAASEALRAVGIDETRRAQTLTLPEWGALA